MEIQLMEPAGLMNYSKAAFGYHSRAEEKRALTILISGPPGTGKSTLASEICFRAAKSSDGSTKEMRSLYVTMEAHAMDD